MMDTANAAAQSDPDGNVQFRRRWREPTLKAVQTVLLKGFSAILVELGAIALQDLRWIVQEAIELHPSPSELAVLKAVEDSERQLLNYLVDHLDGSSADAAQPSPVPRC